MTLEQPIVSVDPVTPEGVAVSPKVSRRFLSLVAVLVVLAALVLLLVIQGSYLEEKRSRGETELLVEGFIEGFAGRDHELVRSMVSDTAIISMNPVRSLDDLELGMAWLEATGWVFTTDGCSVSAVTEGGIQRVLCHLAHENAWSQALGLPPDTRGALTAEVSSGEIVEASLSYAPMSFPNEAVWTFAIWLRDTHPEDEELMYQYLGLPALTPESVDLWRKHTEGFVAEQLE